jgi:hypothetical protein
MKWLVMSRSERSVAEGLVEIADDLEHLGLGVEPPIGDGLALVAVEDLAKVTTRPRIVDD